MVPMVDALAKSWNLATIHLGMALGLPRIKSFLQSFGLTGGNPSPSVLLCALDLSPLQVTHLYQYLAADGHALPLVAVSGVLDGNGRTIKRYQVQPGDGEYQSAVRLTTWALQQVAVYGTAHSIGNSGLAWLHAAGKTGTSNDLRDSWFAGYTGEHLAVFWMGRDDNKPAGLVGATGALRAWRELFAKLPTQPLSSAPGGGLEMAWINPASGRRTDPQCAGAQQVPVVAGSLSADVDGCAWETVQGLFGVGQPSTNGAPGAPAAPAAPVAPTAPPNPADPYRN
jgi:penicillin-binding protein 1B